MGSIFYVMNKYTLQLSICEENDKGWFGLCIHIWPLRMGGGGAEFTQQYLMQKRNTKFHINCQ